MPLDTSSTPILRLAAPPDLDLCASHRAQVAGPGDPSAQIGRHRVVRCVRSPAGPATLACLHRDGRVHCQAWGPGADWALEAAAAWCGLADTPPETASLPPRFQGLAIRGRGLRLLRTPRAIDLLVLIVLEQLVAGKEARRAHRALLQRHSEPAPGPFAGLQLPLAPERLAELTPAALVPLGIAPRRCEVLREIGFRASRLDALAATGTPASIESGLRSLRGIGIWTARSLLLRGLGDADAVPVGDYHLPRLVAHHLGAPDKASDSDDARMLELLAPAAGQRGRVLLWLHRAGMPPRRGPRAALRSLPSGAPTGGWFDD